MYSHFLNYLLLSLLPQHVPIETKNQYFSKYVCSYGIGQTIHGTIDYYLRWETRKNPEILFQMTPQNRIWLCSLQASSSASSTTSRTPTSSPEAATTDRLKTLSFRLLQAWCCFALNFLKMGQSRPLFIYFCSFYITIPIIWKKCRCYSWDSNPGLQDGRRRRTHWAMAAAICC